MLRLGTLHGRYVIDVQFVLACLDIEDRACWKQASAWDAFGTA